MIRMQNIKVSVAGRDLLNVPQLTFGAGRMTVILGPNGAGKSTLLRVASGERSVDEGEVRFQDRCLRRWSTEQLARCRAVLSQHYHISFPLQVRDLVRMGRYAHLGNRAASVADEAIVQSSLERTMTEHLGERFTASLSGGEHQRTQMARVLSQIWDDGTQQPRMLLLDEPTASLDPVHQFGLLDVARQMADDGLCVVVVLHDINLAARYADDIVFLRQGKLVAAGSSSDVLTERNLSDVYGISVIRLTDSRLPYPYFVTQPHQASRKETLCRVP